MASAVNGNDTKTFDGEDEFNPNLSFEQAVALVQKLYGLKDVVCLKEFYSYYNQNLLIEARPCDEDDDASGTAEKYILKLTNSGDSKLFALHEDINRALHYVCADGITAPLPVRNLLGGDVSLESLTFRHKDTGEETSGEFLTRLLKYIPGDVIGRAGSLTAKMCFEAGQLLGRLSCAFTKYDGDKSEFVKRSNTLIWSLTNVPLLRKFTHVIEYAKQRELVEDIVRTFESRVLQNRDKLTKGYIHGDFSDHNILARQTTGSPMNNNTSNGAPEKDVIGIIDFDHMMYSYVVYDISTAIMYIMQCTNLEESALDSGGILLAGFLTERTLAEADWEALYYCVAARFAQSLTLGLYSYSLQPQNDYRLSTQVKGWQVTFDLWAQECNALYGNWQKLSDN